MREKPAAKLISELADRLHQKITSGEIPAGERLRQEQLAKEFAVSRTPIREALRQLEAKGIITHERGRSAVVRLPSPRDVRETYQVRAALEALAAELAARWITDEQLRDLRGIHRRFKGAVRSLSEQRSNAQGITRRARLPAGASREWIATNAEFHELIHEASNNQRLIEIIGNLNLGYTRHVMVSSALGMDAHRMQKNIEHHEAILRALESRDPAAARAEMSHHILESSEFVVAWFENHATEWK